MKPTKIEYLAPDILQPDPNQPRKTISPAHVSGLAQNLQQEGMINPIEVDDGNIIVTGEIRWRAAKEAGLKDVPVKRYNPPSPERRLLRQMAENYHQGSLPNTHSMTPYDTAQALKKLLAAQRAGKLGEELGCDAPKLKHTPKEGATADQGQHSLARKLCCPREYIRDYLALLGSDLPTNLKKALKKDEIPFTAARSIVRTPEEHQEALAARVLSEGQKGKVHVDGVAAAARALRKAEPEQANEIIEAVEAGKTTEQVTEQIKKVAPTLSEAVNTALEPADRIQRLLTDTTAALREAGSIEMFSPIRRKRIASQVQDLQIAVEEFLTASDVPTEIIEGEVIEALPAPSSSG